MRTLSLARLRCSGREMRQLGLPASLRIFHSAAARKSPDVFANSLRKTLEAHRTTNRTRLIRKIYPKEDPPGLWRPEIPPQSRAGYQPSVEPALPTSEDHETPEQASGSKKRRKRKTRGKDDDDDECKDHSLLRWRDVIQLAEKDAAQTPWLKGLELPRASAEVILETELQALATYLAPTAQELAQIEDIRARVIALVEREVSHTPKVIGSHCTGLALAHSDLDFIIPFKDASQSSERDRRPSPTRPQIKEGHIKLLRQLAGVFKQMPNPQQEVYITNRPQTVLSVTHQPTGLLVQFYCGEGIPALTEYLQDYRAEYPALMPLYTVTRTLLEAHGLLYTARGGITPEALAMLIVAFLKMNHGRFRGPGSLADQLLAFLKLYGTEIDLKAVGIAVDPPGFFGADTAIPAGEQETAQQRGQRSLLNARRTAASKKNTHAANRLCIQDPTHYMNDLGRSCTRASELQSTFATAYERLRRACDERTDNTKTNPSILSSALPVNFVNLRRVRLLLLIW